MSDREEDSTSKEEEMKKAETFRFMEET